MRVATSRLPEWGEGRGDTRDGPPQGANPSLRRDEPRTLAKRAHFTAKKEGFGMAGNGRSGRPGKPRELAVLSGNFRRDRARQPVKTVGGKPRKPFGLSPEASQFWDATISKLIKSRVAKSVDGPQLSILAELWSLYTRTLAIVTADPIDKNARTALIAYQTSFDKLAARFGLTPSDRQRLVAPEPKAKRGIPSRNRHRDLFA